ncbi:MAG: hypothetical protein J6Y78_11305 [Paludibacteraceae bacterium]|nr:hypothetical protein [Paludibacteraceae bacterium]
MSETFDDLLEMKFGEVLEKYSVLWNYECAYPYGICSNELVEKMYEEYDVQSYWEAMTTETIINSDLLYDASGELITWEKIVRIMDNLGILRKDEQV